MTLAEHIDDIRDKLEDGGFSNEASVSQGVVLRLLQALDWPVFNARVVRPEYTVKGRRVDFALCHPEELKPLVFMEIKDVGKIEGAEEQLFSYAFHEGVPIAVLTDGREWRFFHPAGEGNYRDRRVHKLDIVKDPSEEIAPCLDRYLRYESVCEREAIEAIKEDYRNLVLQRQIAKRLPEAWQKLVAEEGVLFDAMSDKIESLCRHKPTKELVRGFLRSLKTTQSSGIEIVKSAAPSNISPPSPPSPPRQPGKKKQATRLVVTMPDGETIDRKTATDTFVDAIGRIGVDRIKELNKKLNGAPLISTEKPTTAQHREFGEHYIVVHSSTIQKKRLLDEIAAEVDPSIKVEVVKK